MFSSSAKLQYGTHTQYIDTKGTLWVLTFKKVVSMLEVHTEKLLIICKLKMQNNLLCANVVTVDKFIDYLGKESVHIISITG